MEFPNSPYAVLHDLVVEFREQRRDRDQFLTALDQVDLTLEQWSDHLGQVHVPEENPAAGRLIEATFVSLQLYADAVTRLRDYAETGEDEVAQEALQMAAQGLQVMAQLLMMTEDALEQLGA